MMQQPQRLGGPRSHDSSVSTALLVIGRQPVLPSTALGTGGDGGSKTTSAGNTLRVRQQHPGRNQPLQTLTHDENMKSVAVNSSPLQRVSEMFGRQPG